MWIRLLYIPEKHYCLGIVLHYLNIDFLFAGYYRVNYDIDNWNLITKGLHENHNNIPPLNRAQLLDDALNLAQAGKLPYSVLLDLTMYLEHDTDYIPWTAALNTLSFLDRRLTNNEGYDNFKVKS
jgi:aminopeptidase N